VAGVDDRPTTRGDSASAFFDAVQASITADDGTFRLLGSPLEMAEHLRDLPDQTHRRAWSMSEGSSLGALRRGHEQTLRSAARGVDCRSLMSPFAVRVRLVTSFLRPEVANCRITPVPGSMLLADDVLLVGGRRGTPLATTIWRTEDPAMVTASARAFEEVFEHADPLDEVALLPALDSRSLVVALGMIDGDTDQEIAVRLGIAPRTVQVLVRRIIDWCGARNRTHAVALMAGSDA
jgi:DNA-binding CsgD family transcriptional regulator